MATPGHLEFRNVSKTYALPGRPLVNVLSHVSFDVEPGAFVTIVGPSGCGKSTLLRLVVGLDEDYRGDILLNGRRITGTSLTRGIVFQDHRLLPWLTLEQNIGLSLENSGWSQKEKAEAVAEHIALVGLSGFQKAYPHELSGGMAQRGAIARGLASRPEILLLDEPLGALDALTRVHLQAEIQRIWETEGTTMILVTHDVEEAVYLSHRVVVMSANPGRVVEDLTIDLPFPRDRADGEFVALKRRILAAMGEDGGSRRDAA
ncbi:ABC transporter ATP-binding protein [Xanthobacter autotrophicus]|jgi:sulfonate transport system ATP-binding protein|uniref:ABC transporter ATP-binding protein n=1 Tax=Xanthobacter autotrophicus TaxID=280 RepID=A0A6C1KUJ9_XANAU|nr:MULTISPECIES: ABC transporter ATP-binding protein [Xanthobacter]MCG5236271.1 ABC transporter ATP-binding protein [Xanthobacter oligotrophicus]TLX44496.1 ABC transporter ATP-binding protein [Xanthobacter autotrophicus]